MWFVAAAAAAAAATAALRACAVRRAHATARAWPHRTSCPIQPWALTLFCGNPWPCHHLAIHATATLPLCNVTAFLQLSAAKSRLLTSKAYSWPGPDL
eukprot:56164-Chlamydomonas_euryale.AAC.2